MDSLAPNHTVSGIKYLLSINRSWETASTGLPWKGLQCPEDRDRKQRREVSPWHCTILISSESGLGTASGSACSNASCSPLALPVGGPWGMWYFSLTFLEYFMIHSWSIDFLNSLPMEEFLLPLLQACVETHKTYVNKKVGSPSVHCILPLL